MAINKKLLHFVSKANFSTQLANSNIDSKSIVFIKDTGEIWTHDKLYSCASWGTNQTNYVPLTIGGTSYNISKDGHTHSYLPLSGGKLTGDLEIFAGNTDKFIKFAYNTTDAYSWRIGYLGTGAGNENRLVFQSAKTSGASYVDALSFGLDDLVGRFAETPTVGNTKVSLEGHNHTLKLIAGTSTATVDSTVDVADPYIRLFSDNVHQGNIQIVGGTNVGVVSKNGIVTLTATNTTYTTGTLAQLNAGTDTTGRLQTAKLLNDWLNPKLNGKLDKTGGTLSNSQNYLSGNSFSGILEIVNTSIGVSGEEIGPHISFKGLRGASDTGAYAIYGAIGAINTAPSGISGGALVFLTKQAGGAAQTPTEQMRIATGGNVGIGTTSPAYKLDVSGDVRATGTFRGNLTGNVTGNVSGSAGSTANWAGNTYTNSNITNEVYLMTSTNGTVWRRTLANRYVDTTSAQSISGAKTFSNNVNMLGSLNITGATGYSEGIRIKGVAGISSIWFNAVNDSGYDPKMYGITVGSTGLRFRYGTGSTPSDIASIDNTGNITATTGSFSSTLSANRIVVTSTSNEKHLEFSRSDYNYIASKGHIGFITGGTATASANQQVWIHTNGNTKIGAGSSSVPAYTLDVNGTLRATGTVIAPTFLGSLSGNASSATYASAVTLTADNATNATRYPLFVSAATGNLFPRTDTGFTYNPSTGALTATSFIGALTGNASSATLASTLTIKSSASASWFDILWNSGTTVYGSTGNKLRVQPSTGSITSSGTITASSFSGDLTGNATSATKLQTARTIWGQSFNGTGNVSGALTGVSTISASGNITTTSGFINTGYPADAVLLAGGGATTLSGLYKHCCTFSKGAGSYIVKTGLFTSCTATFNYYNGQTIPYGRDFQAAVEIKLVFSVPASLPDLNLFAITTGTYKIDVTSYRTIQNGFEDRAWCIHSIGTNSVTIILAGATNLDSNESVIINVTKRM